jgi:hypothetical protein
MLNESLINPEARLKWRRTARHGVAKQPEKKKAGVSRPFPRILPFDADQYLAATGAPQLKR